MPATVRTVERPPTQIVEPVRWTINAEIITSTIPFDKYIEHISGDIQAKLNITGKITNPTINAEVKSDKLVASEQEIKNINVSAIMNGSNIELKLNNSIWEDNKLVGDGYYKIGDDLNFELYSKNMHWQNGNMQIEGDLTSTIKYKTVPEIFIDIKNISIQSNLLKFEDLTLKANLLDKDITADITHPLNDIGFSCFGNISTMDLKAKLKLRSLDLSNSLNSFLRVIFNCGITSRLLFLNFSKASFRSCPS